MIGQDTTKSRNLDSTWNKQLQRVRASRPPVVCKHLRRGQWKLWPDDFPLVPLYFLFSNQKIKHKFRCKENEMEKELP